MFNMGFSEILLLGIIALVVIGPKQLPEVARVLASLVNEFKRATGDFRESLTQVKTEMDDTLHEASKDMDVQKIVESKINSALSDEKKENE